ncbi:hypothetical protein L7F22_020452 [Adiantum nelumboides]|nr:hypothetical protein [Adiantum nelumboides]
MRAHELMSSIQYDGKAMLTDSDGSEVEVLISKDIVNEALHFQLGTYDLIPKTKVIDNEKAFLKVMGSKFKYSDLIYSDLELPLWLISQHFRVQKPPRYTEPLLHMAVVMALCVAKKRQVRCDYAKFILEGMIEANLKNSSKNKLYMSAEPMLTRIAYQALGMIEDLPTASSQASLIQKARFVPKAVKTTSSAASSRKTRSTKKSSSDEERTDINKDQNSNESDHENSPKGSEAPGPLEHEPSNQEDTSTPLDKKNVQHWCRSCHNCQVNGNKKLLYGPRQAVIANGPFEKWGIDAMGPLPRTANGKLYILVAIDYMTRFGTPLEIVSDNGPGFRRGLLTEVCEELKISHRHSTPYYPQSNGLVEKANGIIAGIIRKMVESRQEQCNDEAWIDRLLNLVEFEWKREAAYHCYEKKALQLKDKLNEGIKDKEIKEKSLVLRYNNALDNRFDAKFERRWEGPFIVKKAFTGGYYQLMDLNGKEHPRKVNGYRIKPYLSRILSAVFETKQVSKKTKKVCCHCCSGTHQVKSCAFQHVLHEVAEDQKEKLSSPTSCPESSFQYNPVDGT